MKRTVLTAIIFLSLVFSARAQEDWNRVLDRYEEICDTFIELREMVGRGENVSYERISSVLEEMNSLRETLSKIQATMTPDQRTRFIGIRDKYALKFGISIADPATAASGETNAAPPDTVSIPSNQTTPIAEVKTISDRSNNPFKFGVGAAVEIANKPQYGIALVGRSGHWGGYVHATSNFVPSGSDYTCTSDGKTSRGGVFWGDGTVKHSLYSISAGPTYLIGKHFDVSAGLGYWSRKTFWKDTSGEWAEVSDLNIGTICIEAGGGLHFGHLGSHKDGTRAGAFVLSAGIRYIPANKLLCPTVTIGIEL